MSNDIKPLAGKIVPPPKTPKKPPVKPIGGKVVPPPKTPAKPPAKPTALTGNITPPPKNGFGSKALKATAVVAIATLVAVAAKKIYDKCKNGKVE